MKAVRCNVSALKTLLCGYLIYFTLILALALTIDYSYYINNATEYIKMKTFNTISEVLTFLNSGDFYSVTVNGECAEGFWSRKDDNALICFSELSTVATWAPFNVDYTLKNDDLYSQGLANE